MTKDTELSRRPRNLIFLSLRPARTGCRCVPHATGREVFISLWKSCEKACRDGLLAHCLVFMAASPALGLKGVCQRVTIPLIGDQVLASRAVQIPVLSVESCQSSGVTELPIERRWWKAGAIDLDGGASSEGSDHRSGCRYRFRRGSRNRSSSNQYSVD